MWENIPKPWQLAFVEAWEAYCAGSIPIGAVLADASGEVICRGRNRIHDRSAPAGQICANKLAHAELNVLLQVGIDEAQTLPDCTLYTTTEPCVLCFGAIVMAGVRRVRYAAADALAGGADLNRAGNRFVMSRKIDMRCEHGFLAVIQKVLRTDYLLGLKDKDLAERLLAYEIAEYPDAVELGRRWHESGRLQFAREQGMGIDRVVDELSREIGHIA